MLHIWYARRQPLTHATAASAAWLRIAGSGRAAPAPSPSHSADATCRPRFQPLKNRFDEGGEAGGGDGARAARVAGADAVRLPQQLHHSHWRRGEMPADERINSAVSRARQRGLTSTTSTVAACRACASSLPANRACSRPCVVARRRVQEPFFCDFRLRQPRVVGDGGAVAEKVHVHAIARARAAKRKKSSTRLQVERRRARAAAAAADARWQTDADASRTTAEIQL